MSTIQPKCGSLLVSNIKTFLEQYMIERKAKKSQTQPVTQTDSSISSYFDSTNNFADPTTANAFNTSTAVILRKKKNNLLKNSPFDGVLLSNYRLTQRDVRPEVFDWISHFLWLK